MNGDHALQKGVSPFIKRVARPLCCTAVILLSSITSYAISPEPHAAQPQPHKQILNLHDADINAVIQSISQLTGKSFIIDPRVQGKVTFVSSQPMSTKEIYHVFLSLLQVLHYAAIPAGDIVKIIPDIDAKGYGGTLVSKKTQASGDQVEVRVIPVKGSAQQLVSVLRPLMLDWGSISAYTPSNSLVLEGNATNVNQLVQIVENLDQNDASGAAVVKLQHGDAKKIAETIVSLESTNQSQGKPSNVAVIANTSDNSLLVSGSKRNRHEMLQLINQLDSKHSTLNFNTITVHLNYLSAKKIAPTLKKLAEQNNMVNTKNNLNSAVNSVFIQQSNQPLVSIEAIEETNSIIMHGPWPLINNLRKILRGEDHRPQEVLVQAIIVKIDQTLLSQLGIQWGMGALNPSSNLPNTQAQEVFQNGIGVIRNGSLSTLVTALMNSGNTDILATPSVLVLNNQKATISDGKNIGVLNRQYSTSVANTTLAEAVPFNTYERKDVTLSLNVTPQIALNDTVKLLIQQRNDSLDQDARNANPNNPTLNTSKIKTSVLVNSGDILVLGGLTSDSDTQADQKIPILGDIPLLGRLFHYKNRAHEKKNLMIFIRPAVISNKAQAHRQTMHQYHYIRKQQLQYDLRDGLYGTKYNMVLPDESEQQRVYLPQPQWLGRSPALPPP